MANNKGKQDWKKYEKNLPDHQSFGGCAVVVALGVALLILNRSSNGKQRD